MSPIIGKYYSVPCVFMDCWSYQWIPVHGPRHEDTEFIGFDMHHWHIDWRFAPKRWFNWLLESYGDIHRLQGKVVCSPDARGIVRTVEMRRKKCQREMINFPFNAPWRSKLETKFAPCKLLVGMVCPHRGISLEGMPVKDGLVVCPGHGLQWNVVTGEMVPR